MTKPPTNPPPRKTVLDSVAERTGEVPKVLLPDEDSLHGASPLVTPSGDSSFVPAGRGNYQVMGEIARGGMGTILKGHDTDLGRDVALKVLDDELAKNPAVVQRFVEEAQIGGQLQHPGIVPVYELGLMADERPYFTMKLIKGRTLSALLQQRKSPTENRSRLLSIFAQVCQTVAYAHSKGVLHRDLKPANIMIGAFGEVMVVDWGLAKVLNRGGVADEERAKHERSMLTVIETVRSGPGSSGSDSLVGSVMGTPAYMAPEQAQGEIEKLDERADVFSLGAILCEILTGKPPYENVEDERTVMQAARAQLDPARERIETCEADPVLKQLCLDCLTPARAARPRDADQVAKVVNDFQSSVEERAQEAKLAADTAQIKAREARRRMVLALALVATIVLGGGGYYAMEKQREAQRAQTYAAVEEAHGESVEHARAGRPADALEAARRALVLARTGGVSAAVLERSERFLREAEEELAAAQNEAELLAQDQALQRRLEELRLDQAGTGGNRARQIELDEEFERAFQEYGVDLEGENILPALERFRERDVAVEVALALDEWARIRRFLYDRGSEPIQNLVYLAMDLDLDPLRRRLREALLVSDEATLLELADPEGLHRLAPGSIWVLGSALWHGYPQHKGLVYRMYDQALYLYPDDFLLQYIGGVIYDLAGRRRAAFACWRAALALRPDSADVRWRMAESLFFSGQTADAIGAYRASLGLDPDDSQTHYGLGMALLLMGDVDGAFQHVERSLELDPRAQWGADLVSLRFYRGELDVDDIVEALERSIDTFDKATYAFTLLDHRDSRQRRPDLALATMARIAEIPGEYDRFWVIDAVAHVEAGDFAGASRILEGRYTSPTFLVLSPAAFDFLRALVYAELGQRDVAVECHARGMAIWDEITGDQVEVWKDSDVMRWRERAEAALGI